MEIKKDFIDWNEFEFIIQILANKIIKSGLEFDSVYGLPRGGLIPAVILSHKLGIPYDNFGEVLVVDDICDSGETLRPFTDPYIKSTTAVLHYKPHTSTIKPDFYAVESISDEWIVYPWEEKDSKAIQDYKV